MKHYSKAQQDGTKTKNEREKVQYIKKSYMLDATVEATLAFWDHILKNLWRGLCGPRVMPTENQFLIVSSNVFVMAHHIITRLKPGLMQRKRLPTARPTPEPTERVPSAKPAIQESTGV